MRSHTRWFLGWALLLAVACGGPRDDDTAAPPAAAHSANSTATPDADLGPPQRGDWLVQHMLSDPDCRNPYSSCAAGASLVLGSIFQSMLSIDP